ncbi:MAG: Transcriptional regulator, TrmB [Candidatus Magasanikbacteria bacterium GW2011_GWC2_37_14]|uniref:Transcriptional regulator, TrmB n=1 Tax=Candidatus Magasanikbacteria bacterium GW2011_GWC2_37_14 TaxID=1619046 RepID=A0A0G0GP78_9BACT|nr:MAG: Transcriptional regulator, TrmB [Candidatus Magasanikbacteria bacterium GW2011_GWC2_37_14]
MNLSKIFQAYGLTEKQAKVYLACLELGSAPVQKIAEKAVAPRSTVYEVLEHLVHLGFISTFNKKKIKYFSAEDPQQIIRLAESKVNTLKDALPEMNAIVGKSRKRPTVRFYQGKEQMKMVLEEMLAEADELLSFAAPEDLFRELGDWYLDFVKRRIKQKVSVRLIATDSPRARERQKIGIGELRTVRIVPNIFPYHSNKWLWQNKIAMFSFAGDLVCVVTESKELADMERAMFEHLWNRC